MVIVVGSLNMDLVIKAPKIPRPGETVLGKDFTQIPGGKGGNQADACAKLGMETKMLGAVGKDTMGTFLIESLKKDGVDVSHVLEKNDYPTGIAAIVVEESGNNAITVAPGANMAFSPKDLLEMETLFKDAHVLLVQLESPLETVEEALKLGKKHDLINILNPAPGALLGDKILSLVDILTPNETELELLSGLTTSTLSDVEKAGNLLIEKGVKEVIVTLGSQGSMHIKKDFSKLYPAYKLKAVDTTAAGDSYNGALAVSLSKGFSIEESIVFATKVGAMTVTKPGAQTSLPLLLEVDSFEQWYKTNRLED